MSTAGSWTAPVICPARPRLAAGPAPTAPAPRRAPPVRQEHTGLVRVVVTEIAWDGSIRRRTLDTSSLTDAGHWQNLIEQVLAISPPYRAAPGRPVYVLHASDRAVLMGEDNLIGSLRHLVTTILAAGDPS